MDIASGTQYVKENDMKWDLALKSAASGSSTDPFLPQVHQIIDLTQVPMLWYKVSQQ